jgi:hypothetical protein
MAVHSAGTLAGWRIGQGRASTGKLVMDRIARCRRIRQGGFITGGQGMGDFA